MVQTDRITGVARQLGGRLRRVAGEAGHEAASRAEDVYDEARHLGARALGDARGRAVDFADDAYETGHALYGRGLNALSRQAGSHPLAVIVAAGLAGAAVAWFLCSSPNRR
ncbi:hypothetical protein FHS55_004523 [Angulomicrobium tetraedrale]|uniref:CsbD family protein n=1 Tax=Ancylobacter tetraedralis TaxID=217068 RepID=A0A839ZGT1_9HYPH|nr:hypothetical protein [Ancylobacter tetraedralis]MBB3773878.1 hypothetical protein [Ancylobacter tetraedralis]